MRSTPEPIVTIVRRPGEPQRARRRRSDAEIAARRGLSLEEHERRLDEAQSALYAAAAEVFGLGTPFGLFQLLCVPATRGCCERLCVSRGWSKVTTRGLGKILCARQARVFGGLQAHRFNSSGSAWWVIQEAGAPVEVSAASA